MRDNTLFAEAYRIEGIVECSVSSVLCQGKNNETGEPVLVRHWLTTHEIPEEARKALQTEVEAWQAFQHLHLLPILEVSTNEQGIYLVSAYSSEGTLAARFAQHFLTFLPQAEALRIITQVGQALQTLHQHGLFHGNLTPQAVFFNAAGQVCLGECRLQSILACLPNYQPALEESIPLCWYMAPEQFAGVHDALTDQYALGCLAYHLLTGRVPFTGAARATLLQKHAQEQPGALRELNPALPASVEEVVLKALAKRPEERHSSIQAFLDALLQPLNMLVAGQDMAEDPWLVDGIDITAQTTLVPEFFQPPLSPAPLVSGETQREGRPLFKRALVGRIPHVDRLLPRPAPGGIRRSTKNWCDATALLMRSVASARKRPNLFVRRRELVVLGPAVLLVLVLAGLVSHWLLVSHPSGRTLADKITPHATQLSPGVTPTNTTLPGQASPSPALSPKPSAAATPALFKVVPLLDCVTQAGNTFHAAFGYRNPNPAAVTIPLGTKNVISPSSLDGSQPISFAPGSHHQVFHVAFFKRGTATWSLNGQTVTASSSSPPC